MSSYMPLDKVAGLRRTLAVVTSELDRLERDMTSAAELNDRLADELLDARRKLHAVQTVQTWVNEDRKRFVFADDLAVALGLISPPVDA